MSVRSSEIYVAKDKDGAVLGYIILDYNATYDDAVAVAKELHGDDLYISEDDGTCEADYACGGEHQEGEEDE